MANIKSAKKRISVIQKKTLRNKMIKSRVKTSIKKVDAALAAGDKEAAKAALNAATSDLKEMLKLDKEAIKITRSRDAGNPLPEGEKDRRTSGSDGNNRSGNKYAKSKK